MGFLSDIDFGELFGKVKDLIGKVDWGDLLNKAKPVLGKVWDFLKKTPSIFMALTVFLSLMTDPGSANTDTSIIVREEIKIVLDAACMSEGLTNDGKVIYTSGSLSFVKFTALAKYEPGTMKCVQRKLFPVDWDLIKKGYDHIGGISYYDGKIYAAMESAAGKAAPCIAVFDADSLSYDTSYDLPASWFPDGIAWVAVNPYNGYLYTAAKNNADSIHAFQINATMAHVEQIDLADGAVLSGVQGGEFYQGLLYLSQDVPGDARKPVLQVNMRTGAVQTFMTRQTGKAEGTAGDMTVFPAPDGSLYHVSDYNGSLGVYLRSYIHV